MIKPIKPT